jgi:hypothetical protein
MNGLGVGRSAPVRHALLAGGLLALAVALVPGSARAQRANADEERRRAALREGTHAFRFILNDLQLKPLNGFGDLEEQQDKTILIVLGRPERLSEVPGGLSAFVRKGGATLIATDRALPAGEVREQVVEVAGVSVNAETVVCRNLEACYQKLDHCPFLEPLEDAPPDLFQTEKQGRVWVATNLPSWLLPKGPLPEQVRPLASLPPGCAPERPIRHMPRGDPEWRGRPPRFGPPPWQRKLFAVGGDVGRGRVLVLADHSIFINQMMLPRDNNNAEFTYNCVNYLRQDGQRQRVLFVEDGVVQTDFKVPLQTLKVPPEELLKELFRRRREVGIQANGALARAEGRNDHNELLLEALEGRGLYGERLGRAALMLLALALLIYGVYRIGSRARHRRDLAVPLLPQVVDGNLPAAPLPAQRHQALLRGGNLWEPARAVVRQWFADLGLSAEVGGAPPRVTGGGGWWQRWQVRRLVRRLWALAYGPAPLRVRPATYRRLLADLEGLRGALDGGAVRLERQ